MRLGHFGNFRRKRRRNKVFRVVRWQEVVWRVDSWGFEERMGLFRKVSDLQLPFRSSNLFHLEKSF